MADEDTPVRWRIRVEGIVQGVGFRPFVYALAIRHGLAGLVGNDAQGVFLEVEGPPSGVAEFHRDLTREPPPLAVIERVTAEPMPATGLPGFVVAASEPGGERQTLISPDTATCADCLRELFDPVDRRYRYPFVNCTNCGPRFTIVRDVPYDRPFTTMAGFPLCAECAREYADPADRRFHAQPVCCPACGPRLRLITSPGEDITGAPPGEDVPGDPIAATVALLRAGKVVAVKGLGGYHLAADAASPEGVAALRSRKHREEKAFAVMVADVAAARKLCAVDDAEERVLTSPRRPIVLLRRHRDSALAEQVAPGNRFLGLMLPYTPLHHLLTRELDRPFVLTSGNVSDEPIAYEDADALARLSPITDAFLLHDRPIHIRTDDSVTRAVAGREMPIRRSRGYAPAPLRLGRAVPRPVLGCGAELKNTFCLAKGEYAFVSHHIGDLENYATLRSFTDGVAHFRRLFDIDPQVIAHDLHPEYLSTKYALDQTAIGHRVPVQHHWAHIASCLVDNGEVEPVIGVAFDGLGYGEDATIWGGEFLAADLTSFERVGLLEPVRMPGGVAAIRQPWRMAAAYLDAAFAGDPPRDLAVAERNASTWDAVLAVGRSGLNSPLTSSAGRLFDAVGALLGVRDVISYEGQAAVELEQRVDPHADGAYEVGFAEGRPFRVRGADLVRAVVADLHRHVPVETIAMRFHRGMATAIVAGAERARAATGLSAVALSGGVFQNMVLLSGAVEGLSRRGFRVLTHHRVPPNDGGISLGQVAVAAARDRAGLV
ncbi:carbamoyltransferase HypF [Planosporangium mesophilum]|uniref:Carbamoyltransferase n=1 Tax=Planosporangium mesophilum TaxID=689768 RepID=A0A8J3TC62_9ACTN|nr:carbamoyltransferase HypF [Planosporangium mesophilum]GII23773.1 carbamoyltransferase [Planosporangium mesophilum]